MKMLRHLTVSLAICFLFVPVTVGARPALSHCVFHQVGSEAKGSCGRILEQDPVLSLKRVVAIDGGAWRTDRRPAGVWAGEMTDKQYPDEPIQLELFAGSVGILRSDFGWFPVTNVISSPSLSFDLDAMHEVAPNKLDEKIVRRAMQIISTASDWNRADNRQCPQLAKVWSIYCAMEKATIDETGGADHRRPALEVVRDVIDDRTAARSYHHRLMDYNNDPTTTLSDVHSVFSMSLDAMTNPTWLRRHGFSSAESETDVKK